MAKKAKRRKKVDAMLGCVLLLGVAVLVYAAHDVFPALAPGAPLAWCCERV